MMTEAKVHTDPALQAGEECRLAAHAGLARGWSVLVLCPPDHVGCGREHGKRCSSPGKAPLHNWKELQDRRLTPAEVDDFFYRWKNANLGIALGPVSGLVRVDVDGPGAEVLLQEMSGGDLPLTLEFTSGRAGGRGLLYRIPDGATLKTTPFRTDDSELRFQAKGAQTVLPPSRHPSGGRYRWVPGRGPDEIEPAMMPEWLVERLRDDAPAAKRDGTRAAAGERFADGTRNTALTSLAGTMRRAGITHEAIQSALLVENAARCDPPLTEAEVEGIAASVGRYEPSRYAQAILKMETGRNGHATNGDDTHGDAWEPPTLAADATQFDASDFEKPRKTAAPPEPITDVHLTDLGNARRVVLEHGADLRFVHAWRKFLVWDGQRFKEDATGEAIRRVKQTQGELYRVIASEIKKLGRADDSDEKKAEGNLLAAVLKHSLRWEDAKKIAASLDLLKSEPTIPVVPADLDKDPWLLNCLNGTLDLRTGQLREHRREDLLTKMAPVEYDPEAKCPLWLKYLARILDTDLIAYLQRVVGYALTADVREQCLWFLYGAGANGKSVFLNTVRGMLGDYGCQAVSELLLQKRNDSHPTERADLFGRRFVATVETDEGRHLAEAFTKQLTGGENLRARRMREDFVEIAPTWKIFLAANHKPVIKGTDLAIWRRIKLVPFTVTIPPEERDKDLTERLKEEWPGIMAWAVRGCLQWQQDGLQEPDIITRATDEFKADQDTLAGFITECCFVHIEARTQTSKFYESYQEWSGDKWTTQKAFTGRMRDKGFESKAGHANKAFYCGIGLPG